MRTIIYQSLFSLLLLGVGTGCQSKEQTLYDFLEHPAELERVLQSCASRSDLNTDRAACKVATDARVIIGTYLRAMQVDPERFGQRILDAEILCAQLQQKVEVAKQDLNEMESAKDSVQAITFAREKLVQAEKAHDDARQEVRILLAVAGLSSPD